MSDMEEFELWKGKNLSGIFKDIYANQREIQSKVTLLIDMLRPLINNSGDAVMLVPLIKEYLDVGVKNDAHLVKLAAIAQRLYSAEQSADGGGSAGGLLSEEEKKQLLANVGAEVKQITGEQSDSSKKLTDGMTQVKQLVEQEDELLDSDDDD